MYAKKGAINKIILLHSKTVSLILLYFFFRFAYQISKNPRDYLTLLFLSFMLFGLVMLLRLA